MNAKNRYIAAQNRLLEAYEVAATSRFLKLPCCGHRNHVLHVEGENRTGRPLVFVHGAGCFAAIWRSAWLGEWWGSEKRGVRIFT